MADERAIREAWEVPNPEKPPVTYRPKAAVGYVAPVMDEPDAALFSVWMIRWENISYPFASQAAAKASIGITYPDHLVVEASTREGETVYEVALDGRVQDRVAVVEYRVMSAPIQLPGRRVTPAEF